MTVSVAIPSWNGWSLLERNLPAVIEACADGADAEVVVCDDGSDDGTVDHLRRFFPQVRVVARAINGGFGAAANDAVGAASGQVVICLNNDVRPEPGFLAPLVQALEADPSLFAAAPRMLNARSGGDESRTGGVFRRGIVDVVFPDRGAVPLARGSSSILYACGGAAAFRRERFLELGGFHPIYHPFYWEDVDLGWRAWRRGWGSLHVPDAVVHHAGGATIGGRFGARQVKITYERNRLLFLWSNLLDPPLWRRHLAWLGPRAAWAATRGAPFATALQRARRHRGRALERRRNERASATLSDREILDRCTTA